ncbi:MAG: hypothetical protein GKS02_14310 [Alphaproteobacteria bacterium]|nr:hypothetical protein [Alphaproteobacteria bacterium]
MADSNNPSGALPGDPRFGLNEAELKQYYMTKSPSWLITARLRPDGGAEARASANEAHVAYLRAHRDQLRFAGPLQNDEASAATGSLTLLDAPDRAGAEAWIASEPYNLAGAFGSVDIVRWSSSMEIRQLDYPRTEGWQQFAITAIDGPDAEARRAAVAEDHHKYQASVMDRYVARGPTQSDDGATLIGSFMIMEYPDQAACEDFWAKEPLNYGGAFKDVTLERWRYGKAVG